MELLLQLVDLLKHMNNIGLPVYSLAMTGLLFHMLINAKPKA